LGGKKKPSHKAFPAPPRRPEAAQSPHVGKVPSSIEVTSYHRLRPSWRVANMEMVDPFGWHRMDGSILLYVRERLSHFESMTWEEILVRSKKQNHSIEITALCTEAQRRLEEKGLLLDKVVSLRLSGRERVFGYLENGVLVLLFWDPLHQVCPSLRD
jgi:hypothetical protein